MLAWDVEYLAPDGDTDVPKAERTGCWTTDFPKVMAYKTAYYRQIAMNDWMRNVEGAVDAGLSRTEAEEVMGPRPPAAEFFVDTAWKSGGTKARDEHSAGGASRNSRCDDPRRDAHLDRAGEQEEGQAETVCNRGSGRVRGYEGKAQ